MSRIDGRSVSIVCDGRIPPNHHLGPEPTENDFLPAPLEPALLAARSRAPPPPSGQKVRAGRQTSARRAQGRPARRKKRRSLPVPGHHHSSSRLTAVRWGRGNVKSESLGPYATNRSASSVRPPQKLSPPSPKRPPLRAQRAVGPTASHAARRQRLAPGAPPSLPEHWQMSTPL